MSKTKIFLIISSLALAIMSYFTNMIIPTICWSVVCVIWIVVGILEHKNKQCH